jgi:phage shock protein A
VSGIGDEMGDVGLAIQRAEDKTAQMQARAGAIDELIASGALDDVTTSGPGDDITRELDALSSASEVEAELARLKAGSQPEAIEAAEDGGDILKAEPVAEPVAESTAQPSEAEAEGETRT